MPIICQPRVRGWPELDIFLAMGWLSRIFQGDIDEAHDFSDENVLLISDIHLGEDVLTAGPDHLAGYIRALNRELADFVGAHIKRRIDGRRWHLVINGDMFDFVKVSLRPDSEEAFEHWSRQLSDEEREQLPNTPENVVWKLGRILEIHRPLFKEIARFVMAGNRVTVIEGNHDAEFYFEEVQETLREFIVNEVRKLQLKDPSSARNNDAVRAAISFRPWFEASAGRYHIEHGHQYDEYCSFEYNLAPVEHTEQRIATPMSHRVMPYFAELLGDFSTHGIDKWTLKDWGRYIFRFGPGMLWILTKLYCVAMWDILSLSGRGRQRDLKSLGEVHRERLATIAHSSIYGFKTLRELDRLSATPAEYSLFKMMHVFYLDRFLTWIIMLVGFVSALFVGLHIGLLIAACTLVSGALVLWAMARSRISNVEESLRRAAAQIADLTGARYVVFGHSHHPELVNLKARYGVGRFGESAFYINSGSWVTREILLGEEGEGMTYVEISGRGASLRRWRGSTQVPLVIGSTRRRRQTDVETIVPQEPAA